MPTGTTRMEGRNHTGRDASDLNKHATTPRLSERTGVGNSPRDIPLPLKGGCQIVRLTKEEAGHDQ